MQSDAHLNSEDGLPGDLDFASLVSSSDGRDLR